jgi:hypothetical protein
MATSARQAFIHKIPSIRQRNITGSRKNTKAEDQYDRIAKAAFEHGFLSLALKRVCDAGKQIQQMSLISIELPLR